MASSARLLRTAQDIVDRQEAVSAISVTPEMGLDNTVAGAERNPRTSFRFR